MELLSHPAVQSSIIPFGASLISAFLLRTWSNLLGFAVLIGLLCSIYFIIGLGLDPLTSTKKIWLSAIVLYSATFVLLQFGERIKLSLKWWIPVFLIAICYLWIAWPSLANSESTEWMLRLLAALLYVLVTLVPMTRWPDSLLIHSTNGLIFAIASGATIVLVGSALYGQILFSISAALGAIVLIALLFPTNKARSVSVPSFAIIVLMNLAAVIYAQMPLWFLIPSSCTVLGILFLKNRTYAHWQGLIYTVLFSLPGAVASIGLAWYISGPPPI